MQRFLLAGLLALGVAGCGELRDQPGDLNELFPGEAIEDTVDESITFASRADVMYGLPRDGMASVGDLIAVFPTEPTAVDEPDIFVAPGVEAPTDQCRGGGFVQSDGLPLELEVVVTLHPRQYMKVPICGQDERHYGVYVVEDDTGGIVVLRDSRVAPFTFGDRLRLRVDGVMFTFGLETDTRAVLISDYEVLSVSPAGDNGAPNGTVLYQETDARFGADDIGRVRQVEGFIYQKPTNDNFNSTVVTSYEVPAYGDDPLEGAALQCVRTCQLRCRDACDGGDATGPICDDACRDNCAQNDNDFIEDDLPTCWPIGIDFELGRRGFSPDVGRRVRVRGPVVNSFDVQIWVNSLGQVEYLDQ